jgi:hypothetical protein
LGRRRREALLREEAGTTTLVAALPGPAQNKTRIKNIYIHILKEALVVVWVGCMHECTLFFSASSKLFSSTKSSKPITPNPELYT